MEIWRYVKGYESLYMVSNFGRVKSLPKKIGFGKGYLVGEKILNSSLTSSGYPGVRLSKQGKGKTYRIHQLVAISFLNHIPCGHDIIVDHIDGDKRNNRYDNLQLITTRDNLSKDRKNCSSKYTGVHWVTKNKKWRAQICINGSLKYLGLFESEEEASSVYQKELLTIKN